MCSLWQGKGPLQEICRIREDKGVCRVGAGTFFLCPFYPKILLFQPFTRYKSFLGLFLFHLMGRRNRGTQTQTEESNEPAQTERQ